MMMEPVWGKMASKRKITLEQWVHAMKALDGGCACRNVALSFRCGNLQISRIRLKKSDFLLLLKLYLTYSN